MSFIVSVIFQTTYWSQQLTRKVRLELGRVFLITNLSFKDYDQTSQPKTMGILFISKEEPLEIEVITMIVLSR